MTWYGNDTQRAQLMATLAALQIFGGDGNDRLFGGAGHDTLMGGDGRDRLSGGGNAALAKLRLLLKTKAHISVFAAHPAPEIEGWADAGHLTLIRRPLQAGDVSDAALFYAADEDADEDSRTAALARAEGAFVEDIVDVMDAGPGLGVGVADLGQHIGDLLLEHLLLGSVAENVLRRCPVPLLAVQG